MQRDIAGGLYPDGMNTYAAYHVMYGGLDATGEKRERVPDIKPKPGSVDKNGDPTGVKHIEVKKCSVVIYHEHGKAGDPHTWDFENCSGGATIGCHAAPSNKKIPDKNYAGNNKVKYPPYDGNVIATDPTVLDDYWDMAKRGGTADDKAIKLCSCECSTVVVHTLGSLAPVGNGIWPWSRPKSKTSANGRGTLDWFRTYDCETKIWTFNI